MKTLKKMIAVLMVIALMIPCTAMAATGSVKKTKLTAKNTEVKVSSLTYNGKSQSPKTITVTYKGTKLKKGTDYTVSLTKHKKAGTYKVTINGIGKYTDTVKSTYTIKQATQKNLKVTNKYKTKKASTYKKRSKTYTFKVSGIKGDAKVTYTTNTNKIVVKNGKLTIKKGIKKGTYTVKVKVKATTNYKAATKTIKIKVK